MDFSLFLTVYLAQFFRLFNLVNKESTVTAGFLNNCCWSRRLRARTGVQPPALLQSTSHDEVVAEAVRIVSCGSDFTTTVL